MNWSATLVRERTELEQILELQAQNLKLFVRPEIARTQGFLTAEHTLESLEQMHALAPSVVVHAGADLAGYALTMHSEARRCVPLLEPMFQMLDTLTWRGIVLASARYYVSGQVCVAEPYRGQGVFDALYAGQRASYAAQFEFLITQIATRNTRSLRAHERVGFEPIHRYRDASDDWLIVGWAWREAEHPPPAAAENPTK